MMTQAFSYVALIIQLCSVQVTPKINDLNSKRILVQKSEAYCNKQLNKCMLRKMKSSSAWRWEEKEKFLSECIAYEHN